MTIPISWKARELEILQLLAQGLSNSDIGAQLHLAPDTVRWYNKHIFEKLDVNNRMQAVNRAAELGLIGDSGKAAPLSTAAPFTPPPVHYVANGDIHIAYQVVGDGPVDLLFIHGFLSHLELAWENPEFSSFFEQLGRIARVILFDKRGVGLSDRMQGAPTLEQTIEDACCVLAAAGSERAFVMGTSEGGAAAVLLASTHPERVRGLILYAAIPKMVRTTNEPAWADPEDKFEQMIEHMQTTWGGAWAIESFAPSRAHDQRFRAWWAKILRAASSPSSVKAVLNILREVDIRPLLPQVRVKTLVIHKTDDRIANVAAGRYVAAALPNATWLELAGADHIYFIESAPTLAAIAQFCQEKTAYNPADTWIAIVLYAMTNATTIAASDLHYHPRHTIRTAQGVIALFDSSTRAIQCALRLRDMAKHAGLKIGLHVGECNVINGKPLESVLEIATLATERADPGNIVVTRTLHDILAGSDFSFEEWPGQPAQNVPQQIALYMLV